MADRVTTTRGASVRRPLARIALVYLLFGIAFLSVTETAVRINDNNDLRIAARLTFLALSCGLLVVLVGRELRRRHLAEEQLERSQRLEALGQLAGGVAHDFNNLLTVILGYTELVLRKQDDDSPSKGDLEAVKRAGEQARALVDQLLTLSRRRVIQPVALDPNEIVHSLGEVLRRLVSPHVEVDLLTYSSGDVTIDPGQLEQVLLNLVVNARDAMPGGGRLVVATSKERLADGQPAIALRITDTGVGMDQETAERCFEPFFTTKPRQEGTGLGLATVYAIVSRIGGELHVDSALGRGTTFTVLLPAIEHADDLDVRSPEEVAGGSERVLVVEDDDRVRPFTARVLREAGYDVRDASGGDAALELVGGGFSPELLLTDVIMPGMGGVEVAEQVMTVAPQTAVLYMSGFAEDPRLHEMGNDVPFVAKPFTQSDLLSAVRAMLDGRPSVTARSDTPRLAR